MKFSAEEGNGQHQPCVNLDVHEEVSTGYSHLDRAAFLVCEGLAAQNLAAGAGHIVPPACMHTCTARLSVHGSWLTMEATKQLIRGAAYLESVSSGGVVEMARTRRNL